MLHEFSLRNFFSFEDETAVSFCVGEQAPDNALFFVAPSGQRLSKMLSLIGPNASGKTNFLKGFAFLRWFILHSFRGVEVKEKIPVDPFMFHAQVDPVLSFKVVFEIESSVYRYSLDVTQERVLREVLERKDQSHFHYLFKREWSEETKTVEIRQQDLGLDVGALKGIARDSASLLSTLRQIEHKPTQPILEYFYRMQTNVMRWGRQWHTPADHWGNIRAAAEFYHRNPDRKQEVEEIMVGGLDFGLTAIEIQEDKVKQPDKAEPDTIFTPYGVHCVAGKDYRLPMFLESSGTQNSFVLLHRLLPVLKTGGLATIDEFEVDLHPHMIPPILNLFFNKETNPNNAQLLFSTHSIEVFRTLDKAQIVLVEKDKDCRSHVCRLDDMKGVRRDVNLYAKYMSGAFGAVPDV